MKSVDILQGKWFGHPLHPAIVHVPVGAWIAAAVVDYIARHTGGGHTLPYLGLYCVVAGLAGALVAVPTGIAEWSSIKKERPAWKLGLYHMSLNLLAGVVWAVNLGLRWKALGTPEPVSIAVLVLGSGYLGSLLVFDHGTSVARQSKKKWRRIAERSGARLPEAK